MVVSFAGLGFLVLIGLIIIGVVVMVVVLGARGASSSKQNAQVDQETQLMRDLNEGLKRMDDRIDNLDTIMSDKD